MPFNNTVSESNVTISEELSGLHTHCRVSCDFLSEEVLNFVVVFCIIVVDEMLLNFSNQSS